MMVRINVRGCLTPSSVDADLHVLCVKQTRIGLQRTRGYNSRAVIRWYEDNTGYLRPKIYTELGGKRKRGNQSLPIAMTGVS